ncbi:hypothetical protein LX16_2256 [Stackebrandtia albiflava]|uniref:Uncharacterized protein n=1 Tax=Stackebrandtia albiflava TaxID=406432 RepID=A0A562V0X8_9ACTN|nr:hypothetical protein [Stackebrandtia albiflava]TWJ11531.1 hypothetical protein LX16_2256 [Stackebrandtia albiflava]
MSHRFAIPALFTGLIDDAAVFPPGNAAVPDAVAAHRVHRSAWYADLVGPLLLPVGRLSQVPAGEGPLRVGVIADTGVPAAVAVLDAPPPGLRPVQLEARVSGGADVERLADAVKRHGIPVFAEIPVDAAGDWLPELTGGGLVPKFRTGGLTADLFPSPRRLAEAITVCARAGTGFKLTAGLHHLARHTDPATGFTHHGFGNVLLAADQAHRSESVDSVTECLEIRDSTVVAARLRELLTAARPLWAGFGSCSIAEPLDDLTGLSLVHEEK